MKTVVKIVKRGSSERPVVAEQKKAAEPNPNQLVKTIKAWITESRERRNDKTNYPVWLQEAKCR
jgi:hypothetical protein